MTSVVLHTRVIFENGKREFSNITRVCPIRHKSLANAAQCSKKLWGRSKRFRVDSWSPQWSIDQKKFLTRIYGVIEDTPPIGQISYLILNK